MTGQELNENYNKNIENYLRSVRHKVEQELIANGVSYIKKQYLNIIEDLKPYLHMQKDALGFHLVLKIKKVEEFIEEEEE